MDISPPISSILVSKWVWFAIGLTVVVFSLLVKLGFWQLDRGKEKQALEQSILARADAPYQSLESVLERNDWREESVVGVKVKTEVKPEPLPVILLDNQTYQSTVGYLAFQVVSVGQDPNTLALLELGFVAGGNNRSTLPDVMKIEAPLMVTGRLYRKSMNPLSSELMPEIGNPIRVQNLNISQLSQQLNIELMPAVIQPNNLENWPYAFPWNPLPLTSAKHFAYSVQWFAMAGVFLCISAVIFVRWLRKAGLRSRKHGGEL
ncbi:SURF1 family protein [Vibrio mytili]|uniref:SURF1 family protein n=1 Tax=Vibrio mytili TaxID=50718 RepID=UPI002F403DB9